MSRLQVTLWLALVVRGGIGAVAAAAPAAAGRPAVRAPEIELSPLVVTILEDPTLSMVERRRLTIFHGQWNAVEEPTPAERARIALQRFDLASPALSDPTVEPLLRARALLTRGDAAAALEMAGEASSHAAVFLRARALRRLGRRAEAIGLLTGRLSGLDEASVTDAAELVAAARALILLAELEGRPARDYQRALAMLGRAHQALDRLYWPAKVAEGALLAARDNPSQATQALVEALRLNPRAGGAWYELGRIAAASYDFAAAARIVDRLRGIHGRHLLADLLEAHALLQQRDAAGARRVLAGARQRHPLHPELAALVAAAAALAFDDAARDAALADFDRLWPGGALGHFVVGRYLALARQYTSSAEHLAGAIDRSPRWPPPHVELGLLLMQRGDEADARRVLRGATRLDPFNRRAANQLELVEALLSYEQIRTEHFVIKFRAGIDAVLARDMPEVLERIHADVTSVFEHRPARPTLIEIMPDERWFAVRITGMPDIWTIAASTGDVIALLPPREGPGQRGTFDWENVIRHEFVHAVTLDQTRNRLPHWFTEACAVSQETTGRDYDTCRLLAAALHEGELFALDAINLAFVRPRKPVDRALAYGQAHWMFEYIIARYGHAAMVAMLRAYATGATDDEAVGVIGAGDGNAFMAGFRAWAADQVADWGLQRQPDDTRLHGLLTDAPGLDEAVLAALRQAYPGQPDVLRADAERALAGADYDAARAAVLRYGAARPVDEWSSRALARLALDHGRPEHALGPLEQLDRLEVRSAVWARELARLHRAAGRLELAAAAIARAIRREPYQAAHREVAAAIALQRDDGVTALHHIEAMTILEPDRPAQWLRLAALQQRLGHADAARAAAEKARELDPAAPVARFLR